MTLILRPIGRGNWHVITVTIPPSKHSPLPLYFQKGQYLELGGQTLRVCEIYE